MTDERPDVRNDEVPEPARTEPLPGEESPTTTVTIEGDNLVVTEDDGSSPSHEGEPE